MSDTPVTPRGIATYDHLPAVEAVVAAWTHTGPHPEFHEAQRKMVERRMPVLARAIERLVAEREHLRQPDVGEPLERQEIQGESLDMVIVDDLSGFKPAGWSATDDDGNTYSGTYDLDPDWR